MNKIKPIEFSCLINDENYKIIKSRDLNPVISHNESLITTRIEPLQFLDFPQTPLNTIKDNWFVNLSQAYIPTEVIKVVQLGNKFSLPASFNKKLTVHELIKDVESNIKSFHLDNKIKIRNTIIPQLHKFLHLKSPIDTTLKTLASLINYTNSFCQTNLEIIFTRADKGNITVALNKYNYIKEMEDALGDTNIYIPINKDPTTSLEKKVNDFIKNWYKKNYISKKVMLQLRVSDSLLPKAYGLPKVHKTNAPLRIIVSSTNTTLHSFAKFLNKILTDNIPLTEFHVKNSFELCNFLSNKSIPADIKLVSFDVTSLFTNVPLDLAINSIEKRWEHIGNHINISQNEFIAAIKFVLTSTFFKFNNGIYRQTFGMPMGSPLSPIISDLVMRDLEENVMNSLSIRPLFYVRYVDDILLSTHEGEIHDLLNKFNSYHQRLQFTMELEDNHVINFLDITLIRKNNNKIITDWFHKSTFSGRYLSFFSNHPTSQKRGTIYSLVDHAIKLSHPSFYQKNLISCIKILLTNGYSLDLIFNNINNRLKKLFVQRVNNVTDRTNVDSNTKKITVVLLYAKPFSDFISSNIDSSKAIVGYRCLNKLGRFVKVHKDVDHILAKNNVIYKIGCNNCEASYVGQTKRQLRTRIREHINNLKQDQTKHSVISEHILNHNHNFDWDNTVILDREPRFYKRIISEMIHIKEQNFSLNLNSDTELLDESYFDILNELT